MKNKKEKVIKWKTKEKRKFFCDLEVWSQVQEQQEVELQHHQAGQGCGKEEEGFWGAREWEASQEEEFSIKNA